MSQTHNHDYRCYPGNNRFLECILPGCHTMVEIDRLVSNSEKRGIELGRYDLCVALLKPTALLTQRGRKELTRYLELSPLKRQVDIIKARQVSILPRRMNTHGRNHY